MKKRVVSAVVACVLVTTLTAVLSGCDNPFNKQTYTPESKAASVSSPTIGQDGVLRVGVNSTNPPLAGQSSKIVGIDVDIAAALADEWGLKLEISNVGPDPLTSLQSGEIDLALGYDTASTNANLAKTSSYLQKGIALFSLDKSAQLPTDSAVIAAQTSSMSAWAVTSQYEKCTLQNESDLKTAFSDLSNNTAQYVAADALVGTYAANSAGVTAYIVAMMQQPSGYCAVTLAKNTDLQNKLNTALTTLKSQGIIDVIEQKWLGTTLNLDSVTLTPGAKSSTTSSESITSTSSTTTTDSASSSSTSSSTSSSASSATSN